MNDLQQTRSGDVLVAQLGARMHYAVPRILARAGRLGALYTDFYASPHTSTSWLHQRALPRLPSVLKRALSRTAPDVPSSRVHSAPLMGMSYSLKQRIWTSESDKVRAYLAMGRRFGSWVARSDWTGIRYAYTFNSAALEVIQRAKLEGAVSMVEQTMAPKIAENALLARAAADYPAWNARATEGQLAEAFASREAAEWNAADIVVCPSEFVADHLVALGHDKRRIKIVPYGVDPAGSSIPRPGSRAGCIKVLTVGALGLRKGTPYLLEAARRLGSVAEFRLLGNTDALPRNFNIPRNVAVLGAVPRSDVRCHMEWADIFLLPSICEGSATVTYEALNAGRPVVCTPNAGSVVRNGVEGIIIAAFSVESIINAVEALSKTPTMRAAYSQNARLRAEEFSLAAYGRRLLATLEGVLPQSRQGHSDRAATRTGA